jgi:hypothetical protein
MKNINIIQARQKLESLEVEIAKTVEMLRYLEKKQQLQQQQQLTTYNNNTTTQPTTVRWEEFVVKRWPSPQEFTLWIKQTSLKSRLELHNHVTGGEAKRWLPIEQAALDAYPKFEVVQNG